MNEGISIHGLLALLGKLPADWIVRPNDLGALEILIAGEVIGAIDCDTKQIKVCSSWFPLTAATSRPQIPCSQITLAECQLQVIALSDALHEAFVLGIRNELPSSDQIMAWKLALELPTDNKESLG